MTRHAQHANLILHLARFKEEMMRKLLPQNHLRKLNAIKMQELIKMKMQAWMTAATSQSTTSTWGSLGP